MTNRTCPLVIFASVAFVASAFPCTCSLLEIAYIRKHLFYYSNLVGKIGILLILDLETVLQLFQRITFDPHKGLSENSTSILL